RRRYSAHLSRYSFEIYADHRDLHSFPTHALPISPQGDQLISTEDTEAILKAQKHAKWAISALNFEDIPTAVKELREALKTLGARDRKSTRLNSSHVKISYAVFCLKKKNNKEKL